MPGRWLKSRRSMTLLLGVALSFNGVSEAFEDARTRLSDISARPLLHSGGSPANPTTRQGRLSLFPSHSLLTRQVPQSDFSLITTDVRRDFFQTIPFGSLIEESARRHGVDPSLVAAVIEQESGFRPDAVSPRGARGLMQLMPATGRWMGARDLHDPAQNIDAGARYLKYLEMRFEGDVVRQLAAYNAGEGTVARYGGVPPYRETRRYVRTVLRGWDARNRELADFSRSLEPTHAR